MIHRFFQSFWVFPQSLAWAMILYEPSMIVRKRLLFLFTTIVTGLYICGCPLMIAILLTFILFEILIRAMLSL